MPLLMPKVSGTTYESNVSLGTRLSATYGTALTSDTVAHTLPTGNATEIIASTTYDSWWVEVLFQNNSASNTDTSSLVNIYAGAAGSEQVLIPNLLAGWAIAVGATMGYFKYYRFPLFIPAGTRLSGKHQSIRTSTAVYCTIRLFGGAGYSNWYGTRVECVGADTGNSRGTAVTAGSTSKGTLTSIGTNTYDWGYVLPMLGGNTTDSSMPAGSLTADIAAGSATSNLIPGLEEFLFTTSTTEYAGPSDPGGRFCHVPPSTTLYLRSQHGGVTEAQDFCIYGVF